MREFDVVMRSAAGQHRSVRVPASDAAQAATLAGVDGWQVLACEPRAPRRAAPPRPARARGAEMAAFAQELASLVAAGLAIPQALQTLARSAPAGGLRSVLERASAALREGMPLSAALERQQVFPPLLVATVRASEMTGHLSESLSRYAGHQERLRGLREKVVGAAVYPMLLLSVGALVVLFLLVAVVPKFAALIETTHQELPWSSALLMTWGRAVSARPGTTAVTALAAVAALAVLVRRLLADGGRARWVEALPVVGRIVREFRQTQLFHTTAMLLQGGIPLPRALAMCEPLLGDADRERLAATVALLQQGRAPSGALQATGLADELACGMVAVAERTGALAEILERVAAFKEARLQRAIDWASRLIEPLLMIGIGLVIGAIVVMMYLPIFDLAASLQ